MSFFWSVLGCWFNLYILQSYGQKYKIGTFNESIINPDFPNHEIPVYVYYPAMTEKDAGTRFPTVIFAHVFECPSSWYPRIYQDIVPYGYIVAYINSFPNSQLNQTQFAIDQRYTLKWLNTIINNDKSSPLYQMINVNKSMGAGHSEGGGASITSIGNQYINQLFDDKYLFNSLFTMAPCGQGGTVNNAQNVPADIPIFVFTGTMDCICPSQEADRLFKNIPNANCKYYGDVTNATHCHWLDAPLIIEEACTDGEKDLCKELHPNNNITIPLKKQLDIASQYMLLFLNATIINSDNKNDLQQITEQLNNDKAKGDISTVTVSNAC